MADSSSTTAQPTLDDARLYELRPTTYVLLEEFWLPGVELGLTLWQGKFEDREDTWLRWCHPEGQLLLTGAEQAEQERQRADQAQQEVERLTARLRELGLEPDG